MEDDSFNLLWTPTFTVRGGGGTEVLDLPGVLARLGTGTIDSFEALQPHQAPAWHAFLVQLAALGVHRSGLSDWRLDAEGWTELLLDLAEGVEEAWSLLVPDLSRPAFLQPPVPEGSFAPFKRTVEMPDSLDLLVTAKNHDVKMARIGAARSEHWVYSLVSLQTQEGFSGRANYGIARMNGGFGSRPQVGTEPGGGPAARFRRDLAILLRSRDKITAHYAFFQENDGHALLWLIPWDGTRPVSPSECDPWFIEVCRRIRMTQDTGRLVARLAPSAAARVASELNGDLGDPWTPVSAEKLTALTVSARGLTYRLLQDLLFERSFRGGAAHLPSPEDGEDAWFHASVLVRGQGRTDGFHDRRIPLPPKVRDWLGDERRRVMLGEMAQRRVERAGAMSKILRGALCALLQGGAEKLNFQDDGPTPWVQRFDRLVDDDFFEHLWADLELPAGAADRAWARVLASHAEGILNDAISGTPLPQVRRYRAITAAERLFHGSLRKQFQELQPPEEDADATTTRST